MRHVRSKRPSVTTLPFDLGALQVFLMVCDKGGMVAASKALGITQPGVSQAISDLEAGLSQKLFERSVRPLALTAAGALLRQRAILLVAEAHEISTMIGEAQKGQLFGVRLGLSGSVMRAFSLNLALFLSTRASEVSVLSGTTTSHTEGIINRSVDMSLCWSGMEDTDWVERHLIFEESYIALFPSSFPETTEGLTAIANRLPLIRYSARSRTGRDIDRHLRRIGIEIPRFYEFDSPIGVTDAVAAGAGWAITTPLSVFEGGLSPHIRAARLTGPNFSRRLYLVSRKNELGRLPQAVANEAKQRLKNDIVTQLREYMSWIDEKIKIPPVPRS